MVWCGVVWCVWKAEIVGATYTMIRQQRLTFSQPPLRMYIPTKEPAEEHEEYRGENDPFDYYAFLLRFC